MTRKEKLIAEARLIYACRYADINPAQGCLYWAAAFEEAATARGLDSIIQAGSVQLQFREDDGASVTHFSYMFDPAEALVRILQGLPPEIHAWNYLPVTGETVDLTTRFQAEQARNLQGFEWEPKFALPLYFWGKPDDEQMRYRVHPAATKYVVDYLCSSAKL